MAAWRQSRLKAQVAYTQVVRYSALIGGIFYGLLHQGTLQRKYDDDKVCLSVKHWAGH